MTWDGHLTRATEVFAFSERIAMFPRSHALPRHHQLDPANSKLVNSPVYNYLGLWQFKAIGP
ncbi:MAG: hypothetical protein NO076_05530 [Sulfolobales archaeon]|nr:hypothetical protein [Sulfolobales archaeon]